MRTLPDGGGATGSGEAVAYTGFGLRLEVDPRIDGAQLGLAAGAGTGALRPP